MSPLDFSLWANLVQMIIINLCNPKILKIQVNSSFDIKITPKIESCSQNFPNAVHLNVSKFHYSLKIRFHYLCPYICKSFRIDCLNFQMMEEFWTDFLRHWRMVCWFWTNCMDFY